MGSVDEGSDMRCAQRGGDLCPNRFTAIWPREQGRDRFGQRSPPTRPSSARALELPSATRRGEHCGHRGPAGGLRRAISAQIDSLPLVGAPTGQMIWAEIAARAGLRARCATAKRMRDSRADAGQQSGCGTAERMRDSRADAGQQSGVRDSRANAQQPGGRARPRPLPAAKRSTIVCSRLAPNSTLAGVRIAPQDGAA
jgi:hypothetical protein